MRDDLFRRLPKVDALLADERLAALPRDAVVGAARQVLDELRTAVRTGAESLPEVVPLVAARAERLARGRLVGVINATGVVVHTNLGRSPWSEAAREAAERVAGYCDLELDLETGERGGRLRGVTAQIRHLTGAEATVVVNNCAAAVLLGLTALAAGKEVVVSRGELVEIGGSFRVPEVIASGGARLREVGTTNRTRIDDYRRAIGPDTAVLLRVHPSNFRVTGFTESPDREALVALGREAGLPVLEDLGSGLIDARPSGVPPAIDGVLGEPSVRQVVAAGTDLVFFSGDKLLGGPQAGLAVGRADLVERLRKHALYRALRVDKVTLAALEATLGDHVAGRPTPVQRMIAADPAVLQARAERLRDAIGRGEVADEASVVGGGTLPGVELPTRVVRIAVERADDVAMALRTGSPAVVARVRDGALLLDVRTVGDEEVAALARRVAEVLRGE